MSADGSSAGWLGFLIVVLLGVVTVLLIKNMSSRLKRLPPSFDPDLDDDPKDDTAPDA